MIAFDVADWFLVKIAWFKKLQKIVYYGLCMGSDLMNESEKGARKR